MAALREDWQVLQGLFPAGWEERGRSSGAVARLRGFNSLNDLFRTLLMHVGCGWSLRETAVQAKLAGIADVSDVTLLNRLRQSEDWLRQLCQELWKDSGVNLEPPLKGQPVRVVDATVAKEPEKRAANGGFTTAYDCRRWSVISSTSPRPKGRQPARDWEDSSSSGVSWCWPTPVIATHPASRWSSIRARTYACA